MRSLLQKYQNFRPFTDSEAWMLFRMAAFGEAVGWTLLITGIAISKWVTPGNAIAVDIAGQFHGTLFLIYGTAVVVLSPSLHWSWRRIIIAALMSIPPYGTLAFELWTRQQRHTQHLAQFSGAIGYHMLLGKIYYSQNKLPAATMLP